MKKILGLLLLIPFLMGADFISVPNEFQPRQIISSSKMNANFSAIINGLEDGDKDINIRDIFVRGTSFVTGNRNILCSNINATGNLTVEGNLIVSGNMIISGNIDASNATLDLSGLSSTIITQNGVVVDMDAMQYDVYNFYVKFPYETSSTESIQEQFVANTGNITSIKAQLGEGATGSLFIMNILNNGTAVTKVSTNTYTIPDVSETISINSNIDEATFVSANNFIGLQVFQVGVTANGQDLKIQVVVDRE